MSPAGSLNRGLVGALLLSAVASSAAFAATTTPIPDTTTIGGAVFTGRNFIDEPRSGEKTHEQILELLYGGDFVPVGLDFSNGTYYVQRVPDDLINGQQVNIGLAATSLYEYTDQAWYDNFANVEAHYRFAGYEQSFGYALAEENNVPRLLASGPIQESEYNKLLDVTWQHYGPNYEPINIEASMPDLGGATFNWVRGRDNGLFSSDPSRNRDGLDHLITYKVMPLTQTFAALDTSPVEDKIFLLFWEDQTEADNVHWYDDGDWDYNDLVVEVRARYNSNDVPEPTALAVLGIGAAAMLRRRRA